MTTVGVEEPSQNPALSVKELLHIQSIINAQQGVLQQALDARNACIKEKGESMGLCRTLGIQCIDLAQGYAHLEILTPNAQTHANWNRVVHGAVTAALIDTAAGMAVETLIDFVAEPITSVSLSINYIAPALLGSTLCVKAFCGEMIHDQDGKDNGDDLPVLIVPVGNKKLLFVSANVITKAQKGDSFERVTVATGGGWFVIFGKRPKKN